MGVGGRQLGVCRSELEFKVHKFVVGGHELGVRRDELGVGGWRRFSS